MNRALRTRIRLGIAIGAVAAFFAPTPFILQSRAQNAPGVAVANNAEPQGPASNRANDRQPSFRRVPGVIYNDQGNQGEEDQTEAQQSAAGVAAVDSEAPATSRIAGSAEVDTQARAPKGVASGVFPISVVPNGVAPNNTFSNHAAPIDVVQPANRLALPDGFPGQQYSPESLAKSGTNANVLPRNAEHVRPGQPANLCNAFDTRKSQPSSLLTTGEPLVMQGKAAETSPASILDDQLPHPSVTAATAAQQPTPVASAGPRNGFSVAQRLQPSALDQDAIIKLPVVTGYEPGHVPSPPAAGQASGEAVNHAEAKNSDAGNDKPCVDELPITAIGTNITIPVPPDLPKNLYAPQDMSVVCHPRELAEVYPMTPRTWGSVCYRWVAPSLCHGPLYFEENNLERYGYSQTYVRSLQPLASSARFFATVPLLPYLVYEEPAHECVYTLGEYRPGSCVPYAWNYPYCSRQWPWQKCDERGEECK